jgi:hypothetical protein
LFDPSKYIEALKLPTRYIGAIFLAGIFLLFAPSKWLGPTGLIALRDQYRPWVGGTTLLSASILAVQALIWIGVRIRWRINERTRRDHLRDLSFEEKQILQLYVLGGRPTVYFPMGDGVIGGLEAKGIVYRSSSIVIRFKVPYNIQPWALRYLKHHPELITDEGFHGGYSSSPHLD